jgi:penicillin-binding protein 1A
VSAFTSFATLGVRAAPIAIVRVEDEQGNILWRPQGRVERVMAPDQAFVLTDMLRDVVRRGTAYQAVTRAGFTVPAGGKTGTTNDYTDLWFVGFTRELVAGFWMGFDQPTRIKSNAQGGVLTAPAWTAFMREVYARRAAPGDWTAPSGVVSREIDTSTGLLATPNCPGDQRRWEFFAPENVPTQYCTAHPAEGAAPRPRPPVP